MSAVWGLSVLATGLGVKVACRWECGTGFSPGGQWKMGRWWDILQTRRGCYGMKSLVGVMMRTLRLWHGCPSVSQDNASKLLLALMESRHDSENAERILISLRPQELVRLGWQ